MAVTATNNNTATTGSTTTNNAAKQDALKDFNNLAENAITLFVTQLKHQDPTEPLKASDMMASLATITQAGQSVQVNTNLEKIITLLGGDKNQFGSPVSYLGKSIQFASSDVELKDGQAKIFYDLSSIPANVAVTITDDAGREVLTAKGAKGLGKNQVTWGGLDNLGNEVSDGVYHVSVKATDAAGHISTVGTTAQGMVTEANLKDGDVVLKVGNIEVNQDSITSIFSN